MNDFDYTRSIPIAAYDYPLDDNHIAKHPLTDREQCRLLVADSSGNITHHRFFELPDLLPENTEIFWNDTRVINARIEMHKSTGSRIEIFLLEPLAPADYALMFRSKGHCSWSCLVGNKKKWKEGPLIRNLETPSGPVTLYAYLGRPLDGNAYEVTLEWDNKTVEWADVVEAAGAIPIPPYLNRDSEASDYVDYQTVYAKNQGSVASPTAGLHFTRRLIERLVSRNVAIHPLTLHVGAGTFQPVKSDEIGGHPMHTEVFSVSLSTIETLARMLRERRPVTAVGTTSVRTLESLPYLSRRIRSGLSPSVSQWEAYESIDIDGCAELEWLEEYLKENGMKSLTASTSIMIAPGFDWKIVSAMITNFHQPQSTLLLLVSSFLGEKPDFLNREETPLWRRYYNEALAQDYRFLSYGDACLFINPVHH